MPTNYVADSLNVICRPVGSFSHYLSHENNSRVVDYVIWWLSDGTYVYLREEGSTKAGHLHAVWVTNVSFIGCCTSTASGLYLLMSWSVCLCVSHTNGSSAKDGWTNRDAV